MFAYPDLKNGQRNLATNSNFLIPAEFVVRNIWGLLHTLGWNDIGLGKSEFVAKDSIPIICPTLMIERALIQFTEEMQCVSQYVKKTEL